MGLVLCGHLSSSLGRLGPGLALNPLGYVSPLYGEGGYIEEDYPCLGLPIEASGLGPIISRLNV